MFSHKINKINTSKSIFSYMEVIVHRGGVIITLSNIYYRAILRKQSRLVNHFRKRALSQMFDRVLNTPLVQCRSEERAYSKSNRKYVQEAIFQYMYIYIYIYIHIYIYIYIYIYILKLGINRYSLFVRFDFYVLFLCSCF